MTSPHAPPPRRAPRAAAAVVALPLLLAAAALLAGGAEALQLWPFYDTGKPYNWATFSCDEAHVLVASDDRTAKLFETDTGRLVRNFTNHSDWVTAAAFSPDCALVATAGGDEAHVFETATGRRVATLAHAGRVWSVDWSPDGALVATSSDDATVAVWDARTGAARWTLSNYSTGVYSAAFSRTGPLLLVTGDSDGGVALYDLETPDAQRVWATQPHKGSIMVIQWAPGSAQVVTASYDSSAKILNVTDGAVAANLTGHTETVAWVAWSPDGRLIATASRDDTARVYDAASGAEVCVFHSTPTNLHYVEFSRHSLWVVTAHSDYVARVFDAATCSLMAALSGHVWTVSTAVFSADGARVLTSSWDGSAAVFDMSQATLLRTVATHGQRVQAGAFDPTGARFLVATSPGNITLLLADDAGAAGAGPGHAVTIAPPPGESFLHSDFSPDGLSVIGTTSNGQVVVYDVTTGLPQRNLTLPGASGSVYHAEFSPDGRRALSVCDYDVHVLDRQTGAVLVTITLPEYLGAAHFSPDGRLIGTTTYDAVARVFDAATGVEVANATHGGSGADTLAFSPDGALFAVTMWGEEVAVVFESLTGVERYRAGGHTSNVVWAAFSPDGRLLVTSSWDATVRVFNARTGAFLRVLTGHLDTPSVVRFSADSRYLVTASTDRTAKVFETATGRTLQTLPHTQSVGSAMFRGASSTVLTYSGDAAYVWCGAGCAAVIDVFECQRISFLRYHCPQRAPLLLLLEGTAPPPFDWEPLNASTGLIPAPAGGVGPFLTPNCSFRTVVVTHNSVVQCGVVIPEGLPNTTLWTPMRTMPQVVFSFEYTPYCNVWEYSHPSKLGLCLPCRSSYNCTNCLSTGAGSSAGASAAGEPMRCNGGPTRRLNAGYWRCDARSDYVYECPAGRQCLGEAGCMPGTSGVLCATCSREQGFVRWGDECAKCWSPGPAILLLVGIALLGVAAFMVFINLQTNKPSDDFAGTPEERTALMKKRAHLQLGMKQLLHFLQASSTLGGLRVSMSNMVAQVISTQNIVGGGGLMSVPLIGCFSTFNVNTKVRAVAFGLPVALVVMAVALDLWKHRQSKFVSFRSRSDFIHRARGAGPGGGKSVYWLWQYLAVMVCMLMFMATFAVRTFLQPFHYIELSCGPAGQEQVSRLHRLDLELRWDDPGLVATRVLCWMMLIIWVFGLPILGYATVKLSTRHLGKELAHQLFIFLLQGYRPERWWWELIQLGRKLLLTAVIELIDDPNWQAELSQILLVGYMLAVLLLAPYQSQHHNRLEGMTTGLLSVTLALVIQYGRVYHSANWGLVLTAAILSVQFVAMIVLLWRIFSSVTASAMYLRAKGAWEARREMQPRSPSTPSTLSTPGGGDLAGGGSRELQEPLVAADSSWRKHDTL